MDVINVGEYLKEIIGNDKAYLYPNPGNAGDALIALGTKHLFAIVDLNCEEIKDISKFDPEGKIIINRGGGNLVK